jgi:putative methyltransferase (TIGR04325 family)
VFKSPQWNHGLLACLLRVAASRGGSLRVLDFGGSLGSTYFQCRSFLSELECVQWSVVEQPHFVACGKAEFETQELRFFGSIGDALNARTIDVALLSGVLPYLPAPYQILSEIEQSPIDWLLIDRNPFYPGATDRLVVQNVPAWVYGTQMRYPAWIFGAESFRRQMGSTWRLLVDSPSIDPRMSLGELHVDFRLLLADRRSDPAPQVDAMISRGE